jgi:hypothetical protein
VLWRQQVVVLFVVRVVRLAVLVYVQKGCDARQSPLMSAEIDVPGVLSDPSLIDLLDRR